MFQHFPILLVVLIIGAIIAIATERLTLLAAGVGVLLATCVYAGAGFAGVGQMALFFLMGTTATHYKKSWKTEKGYATSKANKRDAAQVFANAGVAGLLGLLALLSPAKAIHIQVMIAAAFASAAADTLSSELGVVWGRRCYDVLMWEKKTCGGNGIISAEGTIAGLAGSIIIALLYVVIYGWSYHFWWIVIAGTAGNLADSIAGATLERRGIIGNNAVNFINTLIAALTAYALA